MGLTLYLQTAFLSWGFIATWYLNTPQTKLWFLWEEKYLFQFFISIIILLKFPKELYSLVLFSLFPSHMICQQVCQYFGNTCMWNSFTCLFVIVLSLFQFCHFSSELQETSFRHPMCYGLSCAYSPRRSHENSYKRHPFTSQGKEY